jgi:hypothetical protein
VEPNESAIVSARRLILPMVRFFQNLKKRLSRMCRDEPPELAAVALLA